MSKNVICESTKHEQSDIYTYISFELIPWLVKDFLREKTKAVVNIHHSLQTDYLLQFVAVHTVLL